MSENTWSWRLCKPSYSGEPLIKGMKVKNRATQYGFYVTIEFPDEFPESFCVVPFCVDNNLCVSRCLHALKDACGKEDPVEFCRRVGPARLRSIMLDTML